MFAHFVADIWINHGVSNCFLETVASSITLGFILVFGITQLFFYKKYATHISKYDNE
jgi:hypothetical protein